MKKGLKYLMPFIYIAALLFVFGKQFISSSLMLVPICVITSALIVYVLKQKIQILAFNKALLVFSFFFLILIPSFGKKENQSLEKRTLAEFPHFRIENIWALFFEYIDYFNDRFAYRNASVSLIGKFKYHYLKASPTPNQVTLGKNGWLFYAPENVIKNTCTPLSEKQLQTIKTNLHIVTKWFDVHNIKYYFTMPPFKSRIYPEMMHDELKQRMMFSTYLQLYEYIKNDTAIRLIDYNNELIDAKKIRPTYYEADTHWNEYGAFLGYQKIINRIKKDFPQIIPYQISDFKLDSEIVYDEGGLQYLMGFKDEIKTTMYHLQFKKAVNPIVVDFLKPDDVTVKYTTCQMPAKVNGLRLFLVRDSFTENFKKYFMPNFDHSFFAWEPTVPVQKVMEEKPDIVIHEIHEQFILFNLLLPIEIKNDTAFLHQYFPDYQPN